MLSVISVVNFFQLFPSQAGFELSVLQISAFRFSSINTPRPRSRRRTSHRTSFEQANPRFTRSRGARGENPIFLPPRSPRLRVRKNPTPFVSFSRRRFSSCRFPPFQLSAFVFRPLLAFSFQFFLLSAFQGSAFLHAVFLHFSFPLSIFSFFLPACRHFFSLNRHFVCNKSGADAKYWV